MKKFLAIALAVLMLFSLAACGGNTQPTEAVKIIDINLTEEEYAFGVDKAQEDLLAQANAYLAKIQSDGTYAKIAEKYFSNEIKEG